MTIKLIKANKNPVLQCSEPRPIRRILCCIFIFLVGIVHVVLLISRSPNEITISEQLKRYLLLPLLFSFLVSFFSSTETEIEIENWEIASMSVETPILAHASRVQSSCTWANNCCVVYVCVFFVFAWYADKLERFHESETEKNVQIF